MLLSRSVIRPTMLKGLFQKEQALYTPDFPRLQKPLQAPQALALSPSKRANATEEELLSAAKLCSATSLRLDPSLPHPILSQKIAAGWLVQKYARNVKTL